MRTDCSQDSFDFGTVEGHRVVGAFDGGQITSHAGGLLLGTSNRAIRLIERLARCFKDGRDPDALLHTVPALIGQRIFAIAQCAFECPSGKPAYPHQCGNGKCARRRGLCGGLQRAPAPQDCIGRFRDERAVLLAEVAVRPEVARNSRVCRPGSRKQFGEQRLRARQLGAVDDHGTVTRVATWSMRVPSFCTTRTRSGR